MKTVARKHMTQTEKVERYLNRDKAITPLIAWNQMGIYRLGAVIFTLKNREGLDIISSRTVVKNRFGRKMRVASYRLAY